MQSKNPESLLAGVTPGHVLTAAVAVMCLLVLLVFVVLLAPKRPAPAPPKLPVSSKRKAAR